MKKHILAIIMTILCLSLMLTLVACGGDNNTDDTNTNDTGDVPEDCTEHTWGDWTTTTYATCELDGIQKRVCTVCEEEETERIPAGHKWSEWEVTKEVDCLNDGIEARKCSQCDKEETKTIESVGEHTWGEPVIEEATCGEDGSEYKKCTECGKEETNVLPKAEHQWTEWGIGWDDEPFIIKAATCTEEGIEGRVCNGPCGAEETRPIPKKAHALGEWQVPEGVTCTTGGTITRACTTCDTYTEEKTVAAGQHVNIVTVGAVTPTLEQEGQTGIVKCDACKTEIRPSFKLPKLSNLANKDNLSVPQGEVWGSFEKKVEYLFDGNKETCPKSPKGLVYTLSFALDKNAYVDNVSVVCNGKGINYDQWSSSTLENVLYGIVKIKIICYNGEEVVKMQEFDTTNLTEVSMEVNANVNRVDIQATGTNDTRYGGAYIWEISVLGSVRVTPCDESGEHEWSVWETVREPACSQEGLIDGLETRTCAVCFDTEENVLPASHSWSDWDIEGLTCTTGGTKTKTCSSCGLVESETVEAGGHLDVVIEGAKDPTFEADGSTGTEKCLACGEVINAAKVITKYENIASSATVTTNSGCWVVKDNLAALTDGNKEIGTGGSHNEGSYNIVFAFDGNKGIKKLVITVNGKGSTAAGSFEAVTNNNYKIEVNMTSADGTVVHSQAYQSGDVTEIVIEPTADVSTITLTVHSGWDNQIAVWEVEAITGGDIVE